MEAITNGGISFVPAVIRGEDGDHCGYRDDSERVIALNLEAPLDQVAEDLADHLQALADTNGRIPERPPPNECRLSLIHSVEQPEEPAEERPENSDDEPGETGPREVG